MSAKASAHRPLDADARDRASWLVATDGRCLAVFHHVGDAARIDRFRPDLGRLLSDLGIETLHDLAPRVELVRTAVPEVMAVARSIVDANPAFLGD